MPAVQPAPDLPPDPFTDEERAVDARRNRDILNRAIAKADRLIDAVDQGTSPETPPSQRITEDYDTLTRSLRRSIMLLEAITAPPTVKPAAQPASPAPDPRPAARRTILREVENTIAKTTPDPANAHLLRAELSDRLEGQDLQDDIGRRPIKDIIADICRDLGIAPHHGPGPYPWPRRTPEAIADLTAEAAKSPTPPQTAEPKLRLVQPHQTPPLPPPAPPKRLNPPGTRAEAILAYVERKKRNGGPDP